MPDAGGNLRPALPRAGPAEHSHTVPATPSLSREDRAAIRALYAENRFYAAFERTRTAWSQPALLGELDTEELIFAGRLAGRLGSEKLRRALFRLAAARDPKSPYVRYYCDFIRRRRDTLYGYLREFERAPELETDDLDLAASWFAEHAMRLTIARDFQSAHRWLDRAHALGPPNAWLDACHASVLLAEDRWDDAHRLALSAWSKSPGMPMGANMLAATLSALGRSGEAAELLLAFSRANPESYEVLSIALRTAFLTAERGERKERHAFGEEMQRATLELARLAPLADRNVTRLIAMTRLHAAQLAEDRAAVKRLAAEIKSPFYMAAAKHIEANPDGERVLLQHRFSRQRHNTCLPASLAACLGAFGVELDHDAVAKKLTFEGTSWWRVVDWAKERGYVTKSFIADANTATALIDRGLPFIIAHESLNSAHACAVVGIDRAMGTLLYHDPQSDFLGEVLIERLDQLEAPLGPRAMLVLPPAQLPHLEGLALAGETEETARVELERAIERAPDPAALRAQLDLLQGPRGPIARLLGARVTAIAGEPARALAEYKALLAEHPQAIILQRSVINSVAALGNTAELREALRSILERAPLPGIAEKDEWIRPDPHLRAWYADVLRQSASHHEEAKRQIEKVLLASPRSGEAYHILADLLWQKGEHAEALLPYRLASTLEYSNDHYAGAYAIALRRVRREEEAIAWLRARIAHFSGDVGAEGPWITLIQTEESFGLPEEALADLTRARERWPKNGALASFAASMFSRYGRLADAERALEDTKLHGSPGSYRAAAIPLARIASGSKAAYEHALEWVKSEPASMAAKRALLDLTEERDGPAQAIALSERWMEELPGDESCEDLYLELLGRCSIDERRQTMLEQRLARNPLDAWAWRELASELGGKVSAAPPELREKLLPELRRAIEKCVATGPDHPFTAAMQAELAIVEGDPARAKAFFRRAIELDCTMESAMIRLVRLSAGGSEEEKQANTALIERAFERHEGDFFAANGVIRELAQVLGVEAAAELAERWISRAPDDPALTEAWADLYLYLGEGTRDAERVLPRLERAIGRFPIHARLRHSLATAYRRLERMEEAERQLAAVTKLAPHVPAARADLADMLARRGRIAEAEVELRTAIELSPRSPGYWISLANMLALHDRAAEAIALLESAAQKIPQVMEIWQRWIELLFIEGREAEAVETAQRLVDLYPDGSFAVLILARAKRRVVGTRDRAEIERLYLRALSLNTRFFEPLDEYVDFLLAHARFDDASAALSSRLPRAEDPLPIHRKLAVVTRAQGKKKEALEMIAALLRGRPDDVSGWQIAIDWMDEDSAWELAAELLPRMAAIAPEHASLYCDRLGLLARSGKSARELDAEWEQLCANFPSSMEVNLRRVEVLSADARYDEAFAALEKYAAHDDRSPQVIARFVRAHARAQELAKALAYARKLWTHSADDSSKSVGLALAALEEAGLLEHAIGQALDMIAAGERLLPSCMVQMAMWAGKKKLRAELLRMLELYTRSVLGWDSAHYLSYVLDQISNALGEPEHVLALAEGQPERMSSNTELWASVGAAFLKTGDAARAKGWFDAWRTRRGVEMWAVVNHATACWDLGDLESSARSCVDGLERLEHDGTAHLLVERLLLVHLARGDAQAFAMDRARYGAILPQDAGSDPEVVNRALFDVFGELLETRGAAALRALDRRFCALLAGVPAHQASFFARKWEAWLRAQLPWWLRWWRVLTR